jgi:hypothetical protein
MLAYAARMLAYAARMLAYAARMLACAARMLAYAARMLTRCNSIEDRRVAWMLSKQHILVGNTYESTSDAAEEQALVN